MCTSVVAATMRRDDIKQQESTDCKKVKNEAVRNHNIYKVGKERRVLKEN